MKNSRCTGSLDFASRESKVLHFLSSRCTCNAQETYEIGWSKSDQQAKVMAQIQELDPPDIARGATRLGNLTISFYLTTYRVLIQGNPLRLLV